MGFFITLNMVNSEGEVTSRKDGKLRKVKTVVRYYNL